MLIKIFKFWVSNKFLSLFIALVLLIAISPLMLTLHLSSIFGQSLFTIVLVVSFFSISKTRKFSILFVILSLGSIISGWLSQIYANTPVAIINCFFVILFMLFIFVKLMKYIFKSQHINHQTLYLALSSYLILGLFFASIYQLIYLIIPNSFVFNVPITGDLSGINLYTNLFYFSFVTLTTLGYGDIVPLAAVARMVTTLEALSGQIFIAVIIARLVSTNNFNRIVKND